MVEMLSNKFVNKTNAPVDVAVYVRDLLNVERKVRAASNDGKCK